VIRTVVLAARAWHRQTAHGTLGYHLAARVGTAATMDFTTSAGSGVPRLVVSTSALINGPVMKATFR
jgi:hypothetical protein